MINAPGSRKQALHVTFDTNTYSSIARPNIARLLSKLVPIGKVSWESRLRRLSWWYLRLSIRRGRIIAGIPEALLATEALSNKDRVALLLAVGTPAPRPPVPAGRLEIIAEAFTVGFRVQRMPRIGHPPLVELSDADYLPDEIQSRDEREARTSAFTRHFSDYAHEAVRTFGEELSVAHGLAALNQRKAFVATAHVITLDRVLWREGLRAENLKPLRYQTVESYQAALRKVLADWTDFDVAATHYGYGYDHICTEDKGGPSSNSIFGAQHATSAFPLSVVNAIELANICWKRFGLPIRNWGH